MSVSRENSDLFPLRNRIIDNQSLYSKVVVLEVQESMRNKFTSVPEASLVVKKPVYAEKAHGKFITWQANSNIVWYNTNVSLVHRYVLNTGRLTSISFFKNE